MMAVLSNGAEPFEQIIKYLSDKRNHVNSGENWSSGFHYENMPIQKYWKFYHQKMKIFR